MSTTPASIEVPHWPMIIGGKSTDGHGATFDRRSPGHDIVVGTYAGGTQVDVDAVADTGLQVGRDIRVIGFDDVKDAERARPALASVSVPAEFAGRRAAQLLLKRISGSDAGPEGLILPAELMPRESCGCGLRVRAAS